jgi:hypothetical protein
MDKSTRMVVISGDEYQRLLETILDSKRLIARALAALQVDFMDWDAYEQLKADLTSAIETQ